MRDARRLQRPPATPAGRLRHGGAGSRPRPPGVRTRRLPGQRGTASRQAARPPAARGGDRGRGGGLTGRHLLGGGRQRPGFHQPDPVGRLRRRAGGRAVRRLQARRPGRGEPREDRDRLLGPERGQGDARRPPAQHADRRRAGPRADVPRPRGAAGEPHRRLGDALRHADRAPDRRGRGGGRRVVQRARPERVLCGRTPAIRHRPGVRGAQPAAGGAPAGRRPRDAAAVADLRRRVDAPRT